MIRIILGAVAGFIVWTILLFFTDWLWVAVAPDWYGKHQIEFAAAMKDQTAFAPDSLILLIAVIRSAIFSVVTGYLAAAISRENFKAPLLLGIFLFLFGGMVSVVAWQYLPIWYHLGILLPLIPLTLLGGKLKD